MSYLYKTLMRLSLAMLIIIINIFEHYSSFTFYFPSDVFFYFEILFNTLSYNCCHLRDKNNVWVAVKHDFGVASEAICQRIFTSDFVTRENHRQIAFWLYHSWSVTSRERRVLALWHHIHRLILYAQIGAKAIFTSE